MTLKTLSSYGKGFQLKVLGALLTDRGFLLNVSDLLDTSYFDSDAHKWIVDQILQYYAKYNTTITIDVLKVELKKVDNEVLQVTIKEELKNSYKSTKEDLEYIEREFTSFCQNQKLKAALLESADLLNQGEFEIIRTKIEEALKAGMNKEIGHDYKKDIETRYRQDYRPTIATPWEPVNQLLQGGFGPGDLGIIFGSPGAGKSWIMVALAAHAARLGYNVNFYTLELGEDYVGKRFDSYFTGHNMEQISSKRGEVQIVLDGLKGNIVVKEYPPKGATVGTIKAHIQRCTDLGNKPDLVVIDYVDYLKPPNRKFTERKGEIDDVFIATKGLAKELKIPIITPSQVNRMGAKDDIIEGDKAAGSYDKMMVADFAMSLSRKKEDKVLGTGRLHIMKNRYGHDGMTYNLTMDTDNGHIKMLEEVDMDVEAASKSEAYREISRKFFSLEQN